MSQKYFNYNKLFELYQSPNKDEAKLYLYENIDIILSVTKSKFRFFFDTTEDLRSHLLVWLDERLNRWLRSLYTIAFDGIKDYSKKYSSPHTNLTYSIVTNNANPCISLEECKDLYIEQEDDSLSELENSYIMRRLNSLMPELTIQEQLAINVFFFNSWDNKTKNTYLKKILKLNNSQLSIFKNKAIHKLHELYSNKTTRNGLSIP